MSDDFSMGNSKWSDQSTPYSRRVVDVMVWIRYLSIHPGDRLANGEHVGVYLHSLNEFSIKVAVRLTVVNHKSRKRNLLSGDRSLSSVGFFFSCVYVRSRSRL